MPNYPSSEPRTIVYRPTSQAEIDPDGPTVTYVDEVPPREDVTSIYVPEASAFANERGLIVDRPVETPFWRMMAAFAIWSLAVVVGASAWRAATGPKAKALRRQATSVTAGDLPVAANRPSRP